MNVKICGITRVEDALAAARGGAWAVGLVFFPSSPRCVTAEKAREIAGALPPGVLRVGVFLGQSLEDIRSAERRVSLDLIQLHGAGADGLCRTLGPERCIHAARESEAAYILIDRPRPDGRPVGEKADWKSAARLTRRHPRVILAGGLTPDNVAEAIRAVSPWGVDVSGGVESAPGVKDAGKIRAFIDAARKAS